MEYKRCYVPILYPPPLSPLSPFPLKKSNATTPSNIQDETHRASMGTKRRTFLLDGHFPIQEGIAIFINSEHFRIETHTAHTVDLGMGAFLVSRLIFGPLPPSPLPPSVLSPVTFNIGVETFRHMMGCLFTPKLPILILIVLWMFSTAILNLTPERHPNTFPC